MTRAQPELDELYQEIILDHYRRPRNKGQLSQASAEAEGVNPLCGDEIHLQVVIEGNRITEIGFWGRGCSISQASASLMTEAVRNQTTADAGRMKHEVEAMLVESAAPASELGDIDALQGVAKFPVRVKCALLAWKVLGEALPRRDGVRARTVTTKS